MMPPLSDPGNHEFFWGICSLNIHNKLQFTGAINILYELAYPQQPQVTKHEEHQRMRPCKRIPP